MTQHSILDITSRHNSQVVWASGLKDRQERAREACFLVEGQREVARALQAGKTLASFWFCPELGGDWEDWVALVPPGVPVLRAARAVFEKITHREHPDGCLAVVRSWSLALELLPSVQPNPLFLVLEGIQKPGNLGAMMRSAQGAGVQALILSGGTDCFNPNVVRASQGALFGLPLAEGGPEDVLAYLRSCACRIVATTPGASAVYWDAPLCGPVALVVGSESQGLSPFWLQQADVAVTIPMRGPLSDSLNAHVAATLVLYESVRQRSLLVSS
jgi:TrmH family RNA methyltransferase